MCNQAADLDSIACCVSLAVSLDAAPFVPIPREELHLRREAEWLLGECGVDTASLAFSGELDPSEADKIILVDHNVLPKNLATLLLGAILIDTRCLAQRHPTTELDRSVAAQLAAVAGCDSKALYAELWRLKSDLSVFTPGELLRKDYKEITASRVKCGFCAIYGALESISGNLMEEAQVFRRSRQLDHLVLMSAYYEGEELRKELALIPHCSWNQEALAYLNAKGAQLEPKSVIEGIQVYNQKNTDWSRKQILPFIKELIE